MNLLRLVVESMRPRQWTKNGVVLAALVFSMRFRDPWSVVRALAAAAVFCLWSGAVYLLNDITDRDRDRLHPTKRNRPVASGRLPVPTAWGVVATVAGTALAASVILDLTDGAPGMPFTTVGIGYVLLQLVYTFVIKGVVILDVLAIATGFVLRAVAGARVILVPISSWLLICGFLLAVFLALCKRRHELLLFGGTDAGDHRASLADYSPALLDQMIAVVTSSTLVVYALYTLADETRAKFGTDGLKYTIPFVLYGIFRYLYLAYRREGGGAPDHALLSDLPLLVNVVLYLVAVIVILVFGGA